MFPSSKNDNPFDFLLKRSTFLCDQQNPSCKLQDEPVPFFLNFPSPFFDEREMPLNQILSQSQIMAANHHHHHALDQMENHNTVTKPSIAASNSNRKEADQGIDPNGINLKPPRRRNTSGVPRKRTGKKDRHSKICTAQGIRDRRMRLSLQIARKFFDLQDMLGFDKASKTIEWLFTKSKKAIKELEKDHPHISTSEARSDSFLSECEVMSGLEEISNNDVKDGMMISRPATNITGPSCLNPSDKTDKGLKKTECNSTLRESRDKARARARSRTREKMMIKWCNKSNPNHENENVLKLESLTSSCPFEGVEQESRSHDQEKKVSPIMPDFNSIVQQLSSDEGTIEKLLGNSRTSRSCPISDYSHCSDSVAGCLDSNAHFMGFLGNWDLFTTDKITPSPSQYSATNQVPFAGNPISVYSATAPNFQVFDQ
ncbi:uncharacterized protein [Primulina eburnea]|uniref:uncharacterized protein n=1 Tax=Primulina eburnea TaxID=1245227 RepID=UPI003C6BD709